MNIALMQFNVAFEDRKRNMEIVTDLFHQYVSDDTDFICLPEMWDVGYYPKENKLASFADSDGVLAKTFLKRLAVQYNVNIIGGSILENIGGSMFNTAYIINRKGECIARYSKMHGAPPGFTNGDEVVFFTLDGVKCGIIICYDLRFTELVMKQALEGVQLLFVPSQCPAERARHWEILSIARAIENLFYVAVANSCGQSGAAYYGGKSIIVDPEGLILAQCGEETAVIKANLDLTKIESARQKYGVYRDRKPEIYGLYI